MSSTGFFDFYYMAKNKKSKRTTQKEEPQRPVDRYFSQLNAASIHPVNRILQYVFIPVFTFAVLGLVWMIPFPEIDFLKRNNMDTFLNWGSFFIAIMIYYYLRLAPTLSYAMLFQIGVMSFLIVQLEYAEQAGGLAVWVVCLLLLVVSLIGLLIGRGLEPIKPGMGRFSELLLYGPIWLWHFVFARLKLPY